MQTSCLSMLGGEYGASFHSGSDMEGRCRGLGGLGALDELTGGKASPTNERLKVVTAVFHSRHEWATLSRGAVEFMLSRWSDAQVCSQSLSGLLSCACADFLTHPDICKT